jgi:hypothetical protein
MTRFLMTLHKLPVSILGAGTLASEKIKRLREPLHRKEFGSSGFHGTIDQVVD